MSSKKNRNNKNKNYIQNNNERNKQSVDRDTEECDKIIEQLDQIESEGQISMSSKVKNLINSDKEAIRLMNEKIKEMENDELDYLSDETLMDDIDVEIKVKEKNDGKEKPKEKDSDNSVNENGSQKDRQDEDVTLDFFENLEKKDGAKKEFNIYAERIRKQQPKRLHNSANDLNFLDKLLLFAKQNTKNFVVGTLISVLFVALIIALALDSCNKEIEKKQGKKQIQFLVMDTTEMRNNIEMFYGALAGNDAEKALKLISEDSKPTDEELKNYVSSTEQYKKLFGESFSVMDCYVLDSGSKDEYIAYVKFNIEFKSVETPATGIFITYFNKIKTEDGKDDYKINLNIYDYTTEEYRNVMRMSNCKVVTDLFEKTDKELLEACEKDPALKEIVDAINPIENDNDTK